MASICFFFHSGNSAYLSKLKTYIKLINILFYEIQIFCIGRHPICFIIQELVNTRADTEPIAYSKLTYYVDWLP